MTNQEMLLKMLKGALIASGTGLFVWAGTVTEALEGNGYSAAAVAIVGTVINVAKLLFEKWKAKADV